jgi:mono/diheme cytochrome c family protein
MKIHHVLIVAGIILSACGTHKKQVTGGQESVPTGSLPNSPLVTAPLTGIYPPGKEELAAIQLQYSDATQEQLSKGYAIYTEGACIKCHGAANIYAFDEIRWVAIVNKMAPMAQLSANEKDAVLRYVLSIKAKQPH